jgi:hypothetical protein
LGSDEERVIEIFKFAFERNMQGRRAFSCKREERERERDEASNRNCCYGDDK